MDKPWLAFVATAVLALAFPLISSADQIVNDLDSSADATLELMALSGGPQSTTLHVRVTNDDDRNGCNFGGAGNPSLVVRPVSSDASVATVGPSSLTFDSCGDHQPMVITAVGPGSARISLVEVSNSTHGTFNLDPAAFTVNVPAPPSPTATIVPTVARAVASTSTPTALPTLTPTELPSSTSTPVPTTGLTGGSTGGSGGVGPVGGLGGGLGSIPPGVNPAQTPELGSLVLFGAGAAGMAGYVTARWRGRKRRSR